jgi:hypothetical protein
MSDSVVEDVVELTTYVAAQITKRILNGRRDGLTDEAIDDGIDKEIGPLCYWQCEHMDNAIFDEGERGYWRKSYGYPKDGDVITCPGIHGPIRCVAENCGFFTFGTRVIEEEREE